MLGWRWESAEHTSRSSALDKVTVAHALLEAGELSLLKSDSQLTLSRLAQNVAFKLSVRALESLVHC